MVLGEKGYSGISTLPFPSFSLLVPNSCWGYLFLGLNILFVGTVSELIFFMTKPRCWSRKIKLSLLIQISSNALPIRWKSLRYITRRMLNHLNRAIDTFNSFENILGAVFRETRKYSPSKKFHKLSWDHAQWPWEIVIFHIYLPEKKISCRRYLKQCYTSILKC